MLRGSMDSHKAAPRPANQHRARWRERCRLLLSEHIQTHLGIEVAPIEVRLIPEPDSLYRWDYLPERQHLFQKQISKHNIAACKEITAGIGESIYAVSRGVPRSTTVETQVTGNALYHDLQEASKSRSFSSIIMELTERTKIQSSQLTEARKVIEERDDTVACLRTQKEQGERRIVEFEQQIATALARFRDFQHCVNTFQDDIMSVL